MNSERLSAVDAFLDEIGRAPVPAGLAHNAMTGVRADRTRRRRPQPQIALAAALGIAVLAIGAFIVGSGPTVTPSPSPSPSPSFPTPMPSPSVVESVEPTLTPPLDPGVLGLTCGGTHAFQPALIEVPGHAESDPDAAAAALRAELIGSLPQSGWVRVAQLADKVQFVAPDSDGNGWVVVALVLRDGRWILDLKGECQLEVVVPAGVTRADWRLDPAFPPPALGDRVIHVLINQRACSSGRSPEGRVLPPIIRSSPTAVTITILVTDRPGNQDCQGGPEFAMTVDLPEPLGGRPLFDGGTFPPTGPVVAYALTCEVEGEACRTKAATIVADAERQHPGRRVAWLSLYDVDGGFFDLGFDDGTSINRHP
jgi:hypothetical protein